MRKYTPTEAKAVWHCWNQMDVYLKEMFTLMDGAEGKWMVDQDGKRYLDSNSSLWNVNIGHRNQRVIQAITEQLNKLEHTSLFLSTNGPAVDLAAKLRALTEDHFQHVFFTNSGSESTDTALKVVRQYFYNRGETERYKVISLNHAYHGGTLGALSVCGMAHDRQAFEPLLKGGFFRITSPDPYDCPPELTLDDWANKCADELESVILREGPETVAAFIAEPVQGSEGVCVIPAVFFRRLREICDRYGVLWISDEVATGFGRTGKWFAAQHTGIWPDLMTVAKGITSGYIPLGGVLVTDQIFNEFLGSLESGREFVHGFTTSGHPVACAAALANISVIEDENLVANSAEMGEYILEKMQSLRRHPFVVDVQGKGLMLGIRVAKDAGKGKLKWPPSMPLTNLLIKHGILVHAAGDNAIVFAPVLSFTREECDRVVATFDQVLNLFGKLWC